MNQKTGVPYTATVFIDLWHAVTKKAGILREVWNRDLRTSGSTEARNAAARTDDLQKLMGHRPGSTTTATVYDRAALEAHSRWRLPAPHVVIRNHDGRRPGATGATRLATSRSYGRVSLTVS